jgi:hypothetical protein
VTRMTLAGLAAWLAVAVALPPAAGAEEPPAVAPAGTEDGKVADEQAADEATDEASSDATTDAGPPSPVPALAAPADAAPSSPAPAGSAEAVISTDAEVGRAATDRTLVSGWAATRAEVHPRAPTAVSPELRLPYDDGSARAEAFLRARYARGEWLEATMSGWFLYEELHAANDYYPQRWSNDQLAQLRELSFSLLAPRASLHVGQQRVAWGVSELVAPNDVVNARDLRDPLLAQTELRYLPTPLVRADVDLLGGVVQGVAGLFVPDQFYLYGRAWSVVQPDAPLALQAQLASSRRAADQTLERRFEAFAVQTRLADRLPEDITLGAHYQRNLEGVDLDLYYHYGFDGTPAFVLEPAGYRADFVRRHHAGFDVVKAAGPVTVRLDAGYDSARVFYRREDFVAFVSPTVAGTAGVELTSDDPRKVLLFEASAIQLLTAPTAPLLGYDQLSVTTSAVARWPLRGGLGVDLLAAVGVHPRSLVTRSELGWKRGALTAAAGLAWLDGGVGSFGWYYRYTSEVYLRAKLTL